MGVGAGGPGPHPEGCPGPGPGDISQHALRQTPPAGGTHPTGMHSCYINIFFRI